MEIQLEAILVELRAIRTLLEEKKNPNPSLAGWVGFGSRSPNTETTQPAKGVGLVDFCKRIEYCYRSKETDFIDYKQTRELLAEIEETNGRELVVAFVENSERKYQASGPILRPERMRQHWLAFRDACL